jgi:hypothetical protein
MRERKANMFQLIFRNRFHPTRLCSGPYAMPASRTQRGLTRRLIAACVGLPLTGSVAFAAADVAGQAQSIPGVQTDKELGALLLKVEQQISAGRTFFPADDSALNTWPRVVQRALPASPEARSALSDFVLRARNRAADEKATGRTDVSIDFALFEDLATTLLVTAGAAPASPSNSQATTVQPVPGDPVAHVPVAEAASMADRNSTASLDASAAQLTNPPDRTERSAGPVQPDFRDTTAPDASPPTGVADMNAQHPVAATGKTALAIAIPASPLATSASTAREQSVAVMYARRGDEMLAIKDISAARKFYEYAANARGARAATALAETYDPAFLTKLGAVGVRPDPALAATWYRRAAALGDPDAEVRLRTLSTQAAQ